MTKAIDIAGERFGKLIAIERAGRSKHGQMLWRCKCDCGGETNVTAGELRAGKRKSCRCGLSQPKHGLHKTRLYSVWEGMKVRCLRPSHVAYDRYGGRGIAVCDEWMAFEPFAEWALANGYRDDLQIDRIDNDRSYEPGNCRFVTASENQSNRACNRRHIFFGEDLTLTQASARFGRSYSGIKARIDKGLTPDEAITTPWIR